MIHLAVFAKYWEAGKVKTRLASKIGPDQACHIYRVFLQHIVTKFTGFGDRRTVVFTPVEREAEFRNALPKSWSLEAQSGGDLGDRMKDFFEGQNLFGSKVKSILIGSDTPDLPKVHLEQAVAALDRQPVVIGPSGDGGYYLIACRGILPPIFDEIPWSTSQVLPMTISILKQNRIGFELLPEMKDVDEYGDLCRLLEKLRAENSVGRDTADAELLNLLSQLEIGIE